METTSEYTFPIFISSTDYNLKDLRAELARFLSELGYRPILSSAEGFPDQSPKVEPWESCLPVLDKSFIMILVIDGRYGTGLKWPNMANVMGDKKVAPTHGEYLFAHLKHKRMLVFIRSEIMTYYQIYKQSLKEFNGNEIKVKKTLEKVLPGHVDFDVLKFINEVKTTKPIPWIKEFSDVTDIKKEVQKKLLNELAEIFLVKNMHLDIVIESFNRLIETLSSDKQREVLGRLKATALMETFDKIQVLTQELNDAKQALDLLKEENGTERRDAELKINRLQTKIQSLEKESTKEANDAIYLKDGKVVFGNSALLNEQFKSLFSAPKSIFDLASVGGLNPNLGLNSFNPEWFKTEKSDGILNSDLLKIPMHSVPSNNAKKEVKVTKQNPKRNSTD